MEHFLFSHIFPYIGDNTPNWLIFFRGVETTSQHHSCRFCSRGKDVVKLSRPCMLVRVPERYTVWITTVNNERQSRRDFLNCPEQRLLAYPPSNHFWWISSAVIFWQSPWQTFLYLPLSDFKSLITSMWWFPEIGVPPNHPLLDGIFHYKPSSYGVTPIYGNLHVSSAESSPADMISRWASNDLMALRLGAVASKAEWNCELSVRGFLPGWSHIQEIYRWYMLNCVDIWMTAVIWFNEQYYCGEPR